jgi:hypothetical protein
MKFTMVFVRWSIAALLPAIVGSTGCKSPSSQSRADDARNPSAAKGEDVGTTNPPMNVEQAKKASLNHLINIGGAMHNHVGAYDAFPSPGLPKGMMEPPGSSKPRVSWRVQLLPFIEQQELYLQLPQEFPLRTVPESVSNSEVRLYQNLLGKKWKPTDTPYRVFVGNGAAFEWGKATSVRDFSGDLGKTIWSWNPRSRLLGPATTTSSMIRKSRCRSWVFFQAASTP